MKKELSLKFSIIFTIFLIITSFFPFIQVTFLYLVGGLMAVLEKIFEIDVLKISIYLNLILTFLFSFLYIKSKNITNQIITALLLFVFLNAFIGFLSMEIYRNEEGKYYYFKFLITSVMFGLITISIDLYKIKKPIK